jgi:hypothetical protein
MKIHGLCVVRNEIDIIEDSLRTAAAWCDRIYVLDNGSDDGTWEAVRRLAGELPQIVPFKQDTVPFNSSVREEILRAFFEEARPGDWWCILDADEFYIDDPKAFLTDVPRRYQVVWKHEFTYYFTDEDLQAYEADPTLYGSRVPVQQRLRYYRADWSEMRFFRHPPRGGRPAIPWDAPRSFPRRIRVKHFQYRSPDQIQKRIDTRRAAIERGSFPHEKRTNWQPGAVGKGVVAGVPRPDEVPTHWQERVVPAQGMHYDAGDGVYSEGAPWSPPSGPGALEQLRDSISAARRTIVGISNRVRRGIAGMTSLARRKRTGHPDTRP